MSLRPLILLFLFASLGFQVTLGFQAMGQQSVEVSRDDAASKKAAANEPIDSGDSVDTGGNIKSIIERVRPAIVTIKVRGRDGDQIGMGTGFVIDTDGLIATNFHVITEGRPFTVELASKRRLPVVSVEASDRHHDLALVRVDVGDQPLESLSLSEASIPDQGTRVLAFGNPLGLRDSVVSGIVSAVREVEGRDMIQLAMPTQPGNSGGPLVNSQGQVIGIVNMKSAVDDNLGFAVPIADLASLRQNPNPITIDRWVRLGRIDPSEWTTLFGASWQQRGGIVTAQGLGSGFGGRSLCLSTAQLPEGPVEIAVQVRLDIESGAAGLAFHADGNDRHYGFYPSNGRLRLTCFKGPSVYSWQVLQDIESEHYVPNQWNQLRVRIEPDSFQCFLNGHLVMESDDRQLTSGKVGLVKFRDTAPEFKNFKVGTQLAAPELSPQTQSKLAEILQTPDRLAGVDGELMNELGAARDIVSREITREVGELEQRIAQLKRVADDIELVPTLNELSQCMSDHSDASNQLLRATLIIAKLDDPDIDVDAYMQRIDDMAGEIRNSFPEQADAIARRDALHQYLFEENGFHGGRAEYYHPANSHLNRVIEDREGLPITLSILYIELAKRLDLATEGVGLPGHFVVRDVTDQQDQLIDVFERGKLLSRQDAQSIVASFAGRQLRDTDLQPQDTSQIISRVLSNLLGVAGRQQDLAAIHRYCEALVAVDPESVDAHRMRAQIRAMTDRKLAAIDDLDWLLEHDPSVSNHQQAMQLRQALSNESSTD